MKRILSACLILCLFVVNFSPAVAQTIRKVAFSGDPAPGLPGLTYDGFRGLHLNNRGEVFFNAALSVPLSETRRNTGMWKGISTGVELIAREFDLAPGLYQGVPGMPASGMHFNDFQFDDSYPEYASAGEYTAFQSRLLGRHQNSTEVIAGPAAWFITSTGLQLIAAAGETLPGIPADTTPRGQFEGLSVNSLGKVAFGAQLWRGTVILNGGGLWSDANGSLELVARADEQVAGMAPGILFSPFNHFSPVFNDSGEIAFAAGLQGPGITSDNNAVILKGTVGNFSPVVREGDPAAGTLNGELFLYGTNPLLDAAGRMLFQGALMGPGVDDTNDRGIWLENAGSLTLVAREGDQAPGVPNGVTFTNLDPSYPSRVTPIYSSSGHMAVRASVTGVGIDSTNDQGVWWGTPDNLQLVAREGGTLPGIPVSEHIRSVGGSLNEAGLLALVGSLSSRTFVDNAPNDQAIWAQDRFGDLQMIVKTGDLLEVAPGDFRQARQLTFGGFNNRGQVLFRASFGTGIDFKTGLFLSNLVAVPEPSSLTLSACLAMLWVSYRRK
jgi:hypothetical protein